MLRFQKIMMQNLAPIILLAVPAGPLNAADIENGDDLHFENCTGCHQEEIYGSDDRNLRSMEGLLLQVRFCKDTLELSWFEEDVDDVTAFLNRNYYHF